MIKTYHHYVNVSSEQKPLYNINRPTPLKVSLGLTLVGKLGISLKTLGYNLPRGLAAW